MFKKILFWSAVIILAIIIIVLFKKAIVPQIAGIFKTSENYQAVFLDNNQVYFGRLSKIYSDFVLLKDVFYIQTTAQGQNPVLMEVGASEPYGPKNHLRINKNKIVMIQDLKAESQVVQAIKNYRMSQSR